MAKSEERLLQLEQALQQAGNALQAANCKDCDSGNGGWCAGHSFL